MKKELTAELSVVLSGLLFAFTAILVKSISNIFDGLFISFFRFIIGIVFGALLIIITKKDFKIHDKKEVIARSIYSAISMITYYIAIQMTGSGRATLFNTTYPIFVAIYGVFFFKEKLNATALLSIITCVTGVVVVFYERNLYSIWGDVIGLISGMAGGMSIHYMKKARENNSSIIIYMAVCAFGIPPTLFSMNQISRLTPDTVFILAIAAIVVFFAQVIFTYGIKYMSATKGSILSFSKIPLTILLSYFFTGEEIKSKFIIGTILILIGLIINRE